MPTLETTTEFNPNNIHDISSETKKSRIARLRQAYAQEDSAERIFLISGDKQCMLAKALRIRRGIYDIDDTLTPSGIEALPENVVSLLRSHRGVDIRSAALTGRHAELIKPLYENHDGDPGLEYALAELGAFKLDKSGKRDYHLSNPALESQLAAVRAHMPFLQGELRQMHGVTFAPNLGGIHQSLDSHIIYREGSELADKDVLKGIIAYIRDQLKMKGWEVRPSSRHTIDIVPAIITKDGALAKHLPEEGLLPEEVSYAEDSSNGQKVFERFPGMMRVAVVGSKTPDELIEHADVAVTDIAAYLRYMLWMKINRRTA